MKALGIDIGSRFIKAALVVNGEMAGFTRTDTGFAPLERCRQILRDMPADRVMATGYGRHLLEVHGDIPTITEIKAFARGARAAFPSCRMVIDIGGQDTKVISLSEEGRVARFEMNDRCAAGTGKFLEVMAKTLGYPLEEFGENCVDAGADVRISSMCTVFAESEVISLINRGVKRRRIAAAIHRAVAGRVAAMARRHSPADDVVFAGGCARNRCLREMLEEGLGRRLYVAEIPEVTGALGAALHAWEAE